MNIKKMNNFKDYGFEADFEGEILKKNIKCFPEIYKLFEMGSYISQKKTRKKIVCMQDKMLVLSVFENVRYIEENYNMLSMSKIFTIEQQVSHIFLNGIKGNVQGITDMLDIAIRTDADVGIFYSLENSDYRKLEYRLTPFQIKLIKMCILFCEIAHKDNEFYKILLEKSRTDVIENKHYSINDIINKG